MRSVEKSKGEESVVERAKAARLRLACVRPALVGRHVVRRALVFLQNESEISSLQVSKSGNAPFSVRAILLFEFSEPERDCKAK